jgi:toxin-antitoxin system PIN domain toxin
MILIDANLLLYAYDSSSEYHKNAKNWLQEILSQAEPVRLSWMTILAFLRISTNPRAFTRPLSINEALAVVSEWLSIPSVHILNPTERHFEIMKTLLPAAQVLGPLVMDGHLAALAIEHGATLYTNDKDFARFSGVRVRNPLQ